ncbi:MAG: alkanesulfonate monooxygenase SsuD [Acidimicrobiales bacterium]|jgi:alkanesulfonate monooxygenase SsuD/methylene tetrahydromethanopterin reductase-like flavin-dependent oxidoreductase (luciferase family)
MQFGLMDHAETRPSVPLGQIFRERIEYVQAAEDAGIWGYHTTEHHLSALDSTPSPALLLSAMAPMTERIKLCSLVHILPGYHPVRLAEEVIMLDHLTNGRFQMGVGKGVSPPEHRLLDLDTATIAEVFDDHLQRMTAVLEGEPVDGAANPFECVQDPYPPLWYAGNAARAAELNMNAMVGGPPQAVAAAVAEHRRICAERTEPPRYNPTITRTTIGASRHVVIRPDSQVAKARAVKAWELYTPHINHHFWRTGESASKDPSFGGDSAAAMAASALVAGSPQEVTESYIEMAKVGGPDYLLGAFFWGDIDQAEAMQSFELFVTEVIPAVEAALG